MRPLRRLGPHGFDLDAPEQFSHADDEVITFTVSPRLGDSESATSRRTRRACLYAQSSQVVRRFGLQSFFRDRQSGPKREQDRDPSDSATHRSGYVRRAQYFGTRLIGRVSASISAAGSDARETLQKHEERSYRCALGTYPIAIFRVAHSKGKM